MPQNAWFRMTSTAFETNPAALRVLSASSPTRARRQKHVYASGACGAGGAAPLAADPPRVSRRRSSSPAAAPAAPLQEQLGGPIDRDVHVAAAGVHPAVRTRGGALPRRAGSSVPRAAASGAAARAAPAAGPPAPSGTGADRPSPGGCRRTGTAPRTNWTRTTAARRASDTPKIDHHARGDVARLVAHAGRRGRGARSRRSSCDSHVLSPIP